MQLTKIIQQKLQANRMYGFVVFCNLSTKNQVKHLLVIFKVAQEEEPAVELTEEQLERIRRNRLLAFEKHEAKKRRLEESQTR